MLLGMLLALGLVASMLTYWATVRAPSLLARPDNPRLIESELRTRRGRILGASGEVLAESVAEGEVYRRVYPYASAGAAVGYYTVRYGTSGIESGFDALLRGAPADDSLASLRREFIHEPMSGRDVRLTLDAAVQQAADALFGGRQGALVLISLPDRAVRAMVSKPGFDPNTLESVYETLAERRDAPLLNRAAQGQYQPGPILFPLLVAWGVDQNLLVPSEPAPDAGTTVRMNGRTLDCSYPVGPGAGWAEALEARCPGSLAALGRALGAERIGAAYEAFGLLVAPDLPIETTSAADLTVSDAGLAALGQNGLTLSPLQLVLAVAAVGDRGLLADATLVDATQLSEGQWRDAPPSEPRQAISTAAASQAVMLLPEHDGLLDFSALSLAGPDEEVAWYLGMAPAGAPRYAVVVIVEGATTVGPAEQIGRSLLAHVVAR
jgi:peptidoglycan glycosyltransferase